MFTEAFKNGGVNSTHRYFSRLANLTPAQFEEFENQIVAYEVESLAFTPDGRMNFDDRLRDKQMRELFGDEIAQKYKDYGRMAWAYGLATNVAVAVADVAPHLSDDQVERIARVIAANNDNYRSGKYMAVVGIRPVGQNWDAVIAETKAVLSPEQWAAAEGVLVPYRFKQAVDQARQAMLPAAPAKP